MRDYEVMTIHRPDLAEDEVESKIADLESHLSGSGATVDGRDMWGKRRFAYEMGVLAHLTADVSFPLNASDDDVREPLYREATKTAADSSTPVVPGQQETSASISVTFSLR